MLDLEDARVVDNLTCMYPYFERESGPSTVAKAYAKFRTIVTGLTLDLLVLHRIGSKSSR